jgi:hypothetical protein
MLQGIKIWPRRKEKNRKGDLLDLENRRLGGGN